MDKSIFKNVLKYYANAQSLEEFTIRLDLINWTLNDFNSMYLEMIVSRCPIFFKMLQTLKRDDKYDDNFDVVKFTNINKWKIKAPTDIKITDTNFSVTCFDGKNFITQNALIINDIKQFGLDPIAECAIVLITELYGGTNGEI